MSQSRQRILDAAEALFAERGLAATAMTDIADRVGVRGPALYKHYANKQAIFEAVLERLFKPFQAMLNQLIEDQIDTAIADIVAHHIAHPNISRIIQHATLAGGDALRILADQWYVPFFEKIQNAVDAAGYDRSSLLLLHSAILGYITLAPLHEAIFGIDPLGEPETQALCQRLAKISETLGVRSQ